jgi:uncharacterized repeat protein (TIGR01451 family)
MARMGTGSPPPSAHTLASELGKLMSSKAKAANKNLARSAHDTLGLCILGGPEPPANAKEAAERIDRLWIWLRDFLDGGEFEDEITNDPAFDRFQTDSAEIGRPEDWKAAARLVFRFEERGDSWRCEQVSNLPDLEKEADEEIRGGIGSDRYFRDILARPILEALGRLLLKAESVDRKEHGLPASELAQPLLDEVSKPTPNRSPRAKSIAVVGLLAALLVVVVFAVANRSTRATLGPQELRVSVRGGIVHDRSEVSLSPNQLVDLGTSGGVHEVASYAVVRPVRGLTGDIPTDLDLALVVPRKSLTNQVPVSASLEFSGAPVREIGQQVSDAITISSRLQHSLALDIPRELRVQIKPSGSSKWGEPRQLAATKWRSCSVMRCEWHLPLAQLTHDNGDAVRVGFQTLVFGLPDEHEPSLVLDMEQRRLHDRLTTDGELLVSPGSRVLYQFYVANRGTAPAHNVVLRLALPQAVRLVPGSVRVSTTGAVTPSALEDNFAGGGIKYAKFGPGAEATYRALAEIRPSARAGSEAYPYWIVRSDETNGSKFYDSVTTSVR